MMKTRGWQVIAVAALTAAACNNRATEPDPAAAARFEVQAGDTVRLRPNEVAAIGNSGVQVRFRGVAADSRCPIDALCVWPGDAEVQIGVTLNRMAWQERTIHSFTEPRATEFNGYVFKLVEVAPAPVSTSTTKPEDYVVAIEVTRR